MKNLFNHLLDLLDMLYTLLVPITYFGYIIYLRLIVTREPSLVLIPLSDVRLYFVSWIMLTLILRIYILLKLDGILKTKEKKHPIILKLTNYLQKISNHFKEVMHNCYYLLLGRHLKFACYLMKVLDWIDLVGANLASVILISLEILPRLIVLIVFLIDIFYFRQLLYSYKFVGLLLLPVLLSIFESIIEFYYEDNAEDQLKLIDYSVKKDASGKDIYRYWFTNEKRNPPHVKNLKDFMLDHLLPTQSIPTVLRDIEVIRSYFKFLRCKIVISIGFLIGWSIIFIVGIGF